MVIAFLRYFKKPPVKPALCLFALLSFGIAFKSYGQDPHFSQFFEAPGSFLPGLRVLEKERDAEVHAVSRDFAIGDLDVLLGHPGTPDAVDRLGRAPDSFLDRLLEAVFVLRRDLDDFCD